MPILKSLWSLITKYITGVSKSERVGNIKQIVLEKLPEDNYLVLKFIVNFLSKVINSACVFSKLSLNIVMNFSL